MSETPTALRPAPWVRANVTAYRLEDGVLREAPIDDATGEILERLKTETHVGLDQGLAALASALRERDALLRHAQTSRFALAYLLEKTVGGAS